MDTTMMTALPPNTLGTNALIFMLSAWTFVLALVFWSYRKLLSAPANEKLPSAGSIP